MTTRIVAFLLGIALLPGCNLKCEKNIFEPQEVKWFEVYDKGQEIIFRSNLGRYDTVTINDKQLDFTDCIRYERGAYQNNIARIDMASKILGNLNHYKFEKEEKNTSCSKCFRLGDLVECYSSMETDVRVERIEINSLHKTIESYKIDKSNAQSLDKHFVESFNWSPEYGLVKYQIEGGETFELMKLK